MATIPGLRPHQAIFRPPKIAGAVSIGITAPAPPLPSPMLLTYNTALIAGSTISFYLTSPDVEIDWGDASASTVTTTGLASHTYAADGTYVVTVNALSYTPLARFEASRFLVGGTPAALTAANWGTFPLTSLQGALRSATNLTSVSAPPATVTNMQGMFGGAAAFNQAIGSWNVSAVTNMDAMFAGAAAFNQDLSAWDVSSVTNMEFMFEDASAFNGDVSAWDVSSVTNMGIMFRNTPFNRNISAWDVSSVTNMASMFEGATAFNQPIGTWNTSSVTSMANMFRSATAFNGDISGWNTSSVTTMLNMFRSATAFNQDISGWDVSAASSMGGMFQSATTFNRDLSGWCVSLIPSVPANFATGATSWALAQPVWGTCPP